MPETTPKPPGERLASPLHAFRFQVDFWEAPLAGRADSAQTRSGSAPTAAARGSAQPLCQGAFSEVTGLEATMEPLAISEGGVNWGQHQRVGRTTFSTVILRRGMTVTRHLWQWFSHVAKQGGYKQRLEVEISLLNQAGEQLIIWKLERAMPVKLKIADLAAAGQEVAVEELHLVFESLEELPGSGQRMTP